MSRVGKLVGGSLYIHQSAICALDDEQQEIVEHAQSLIQKPHASWNVVRVSDDNVAFLDYPQFEDHAFPELMNSIRVDLLEGACSERSYEHSQNRPVLHRKELLLLDGHPRRTEFAKLTRELEKLGLFYDTHIIGFREQWEARLALHKVTVEGHSVAAEVVNSDELDIQRHRAAIVRYQLSKPVQLLIQTELLTKERSFFDYGCGRRNDVETLIEAGFNAGGWDPHYFPETELKPADVVNLGFVLNVIEDAIEREDALKNAWAMTHSILAVAVITPNSGSMNYARPFRDGFLTSRGTFQKFFSQDELRAYIEAVLGLKPIPVSTGIFFVFKEEQDEQEFLLRRFDSTRSLAVLPPSKRPAVIQKLREDRFERLAPVLEHLADEMRRFGRRLFNDELSPELVDQMRAYRVSKKTAEAICFERLLEEDDLQEVFERRKNDVLVYMASQQFDRARRYSKLSARLKGDIKVGWGNYANVQNEARRLLFSVADQDVIDEACENVLDDELGYMLPKFQLQFNVANLTRLPLPLRCYVACASVLYGDVEDADLIKIHSRSRKLSLMTYENFDGRLPVLKKRVKIDLKSQKVRIYEYDYENRQYLYMKSLYMNEADFGYAKQVIFDRKLMSLPKFDFSSYGPNAKAFEIAVKNII